ncbi:hypothetical protein OB03_05270 [Brevundimonas sp. GN22]|uniref:hypothetical protein n=1 Tax=Brevundimonas pishanensis TaxID=2896315 RepID=UPI001FA6C9A8|nr:hypothetical protein [Brevundimonas pishanensis]
MIAALALLVMAGANPIPQPAVKPVAALVRVRRQAVPTEMVQSIPVTLHQPTVCAAHMELLLEKLSARDEEPDASFLMVQEYWQERLPDPDGPGAISDDLFARIKERLDATATNDAQTYLASLQECVVAAARSGALQ